ELPSEPKTETPLRNYQKKMLASLKTDAAAKVSPWLGLASPMQTGKSHLIGPIVKMLEKQYGPDTQFVVLSSSRIITKQLVEDMVGHFDEAVGRFDGLHKEKKRITVASAWALARNLEQFSPKGKIVLINDEAYSTQAETFRKIYGHFGFGEVQEVDGRS